LNEFEILSETISGKDDTGKRIYDSRVISNEDLVEIQKCVLHALGLSHLTNYI
jgi:hypothetical protein